ncbi:MAG: hypothetical protein LBC75_00070 [Fibromonadaceae bacterium]|jgi:hypothetical protein|nr:hypothetical protein [Fibromonadaceae bacterium]
MIKSWRTYFNEYLKEEYENGKFGSSNEKIEGTEKTEIEKAKIEKIEKMISNFFGKNDIPINTYYQYDYYEYNDKAEDTGEVENAEAETEAKSKNIIIAALYTKQEGGTRYRLELEYNENFLGSNKKNYGDIDFENRYINFLKSDLDIAWHIAIEEDIEFYQLLKKENFYKNTIMPKTIKPEDINKAKENNFFPEFINKLGKGKAEFNKEKGLWSYKIFHENKIQLLYPLGKPPKE